MTHLLWSESRRARLSTEQVLVTHASGLALQTLIASTADPRGPEVYLDNADPFGVFVTVNLTMFMVVTGWVLSVEWLRGRGGGRYLGCFVSC